LHVLAVFAASTALALAPASAHAIGMTKPEKQMLALINHAAPNTDCTR